MAKIIPRLNSFHDAKNWLSMRPKAQYLAVVGEVTDFGEFNEDNKLHGRGISIWSHGAMTIGYAENGPSTGNYIRIESNG